MNCLKPIVSRVGDGLDFQVSRVNSGLEFRVGVVCSVSDVSYLNVQPEYVWLMPENNFTDEVVVYSNVVWNVS